MHPYYRNTAQRHVAETTAMADAFRQSHRRMKVLRGAMDVITAFMLGAVFILLIVLDYTD